MNVNGGAKGGRVGDEVFFCFFLERGRLRSGNRDVDAMKKRENAGKGADQGVKECE